MILTTVLRTALGLAACSLAPFCALALAQEVNIVPRAQPGHAIDASMPHPDLKVDVPLVLIPVQVTTPLGVSITGLKKGNFRLFEDGVEQTITQFGQEDVPISIGLVFDSSSSMRNKLQKSMEAAAAFFKTANSEDEFFLIEFSERAKLAVPFTRDSDEIYKRIIHAWPFGRTSLLDAIHLGLVQMKKARHPRKAIVILSDGGDNCSRYTAGEIKGAVRESDVQVYAMGIFDPVDARKRTAEEQNGPHLLDELAEATGGSHYPVRNLSDLPEICARIGSELRNEYLLGYSPALPRNDGKYRRIEVTILPPPDAPLLKANYRQGYYAGAH